MLSTSALRTTRALPQRLQPGLLTSCTACYSTPASTRPTKFQRPKPQSPILQNSTFKITIRPASTASPSPSTTSTTSSTSDVHETLTWNRFLALRKTRRRISVVTSLLSAVGTTAFGVTFLVQNNADAWAATLGLDPIIMFGLGTIGFAAMGWLVGPFFGNAMFRGWYRRVGGQIDEKERAFYARIKKHRVDPTSSSMANPVPDYYGEKIGSVADYRRWLKDQRAFNLKRGGYKTVV